MESTLQIRVLHFLYQGAKNHGVVMPDANKENTINQLVGAAFGAAGQRCMALSTAIFVGESRDWLPELVERSKSLRVNAGDSICNGANSTTKCVLHVFFFTFQTKFSSGRECDIQCKVGRARLIAYRSLIMKNFIDLVKL